MAIETSTLEQLTERARNAFRAHLPDSNSWLYPNNLWIVATVIGGLFWEALGTVRRMPDIIMPDRAEGQYLERWAALYGIQRILASNASGLVRLPGADGVAVPVGTVFNIAGNQYTAIEAATWDGTDAFIRVEADDIGDSFNLPAGTAATLGNVIAGVTSAVVDTDGIDGGLCNESDDDLRERLLLRMRSRQRYGTLCDFKEWALEVAGVKRTWSKRGPSGITVYVELDGAGIDEVNDYLNDECRKPVCAVVKAIEVEQQLIPLTLNCNAAVTAADQALIQSTLDAWIYDNTAPGQCVTAEQLEDALCKVDKNVTITSPDGTGVFCPESDLHIFSAVAITYG